MATPPFAGAGQDTNAWVFPAAAATLEGALGTVVGVAETVAKAVSPLAFVAVIVNW